MLRALRRILKPGGRTAFITIATAGDLATSEKRRATRDGPPVPSSTRPIDVLMEAAGYSNVTEEDVTAQFLATAQSWDESAETYEDSLRELFGDAEYSQICRDRRAMIRAIEDGLLTRRIYTGRIH